MTEHGCIYILTNPSFKEYVKIGYATSLGKRLKQLNRSETVPFAFRAYAIYDLLFSDNLFKDDIKKLKAVFVDLLNKLKEQIRKLDHWTDKEETQAVVAILIRDTLWAELLEDCMPQFDTYPDKVYRYMCDYYKYMV